MSFELSATNLTDTSVSLVMTLTSDYDSETVVSLSFQQGGPSGQTVYTASATISDEAQTGDEITTDIGNHLTASTTYYVAATISGGVLVDDLTITTKATGYNTPRTATQEQWEDLANRIKTLQPPLVISLSAPVTTAQNLTADVVSALKEAYESGRPVVVDARAQRVTPSEAIDDFTKGIFIVTKINRAGFLSYQLSLDTIAETSFKRFTRKSYFVSVSSSSPYGWSCYEVNSDSYQIVETNTGATWIDGSPIYKKTIAIGALPNADVKSVPHGITNLHRVLKLEGYAYNPTDSQFFSFSYASPTSVSISIGVFVQGSDVRVRTGTDRTNCTESYVTIYYTKSS